MPLPFATVDSFQTFDGLLLKQSAWLGVRASDWRGRSCECHCHPGDSDPTSELAAPSAPFTCGRPIGNPVLRAQRSIKARICASPLACNQPQVPLTACRPAGALPQRGCHVDKTSSTRLIPTFDLPPLIHLAALLNHSFGSLIYRVPLPLLHTENLRVRRPPRLASPTRPDVRASSLDIHHAHHGNACFPSLGNRCRTIHGTVMLWSPALSDRRLLRVVQTFDLCTLYPPLCES